MKKFILYHKNDTTPYYVQIEPLIANLYLEFGETKTNNTCWNKMYRYVSLIRGDSKNPSLLHTQLYFTHKIRNKWRVLSDDCIKFVEDYNSKREAVNRLKMIAFDLLSPI